MELSTEICNRRPLCRSVRALFRSLPFWSFIISFAFFAVIAWNSPLTSDDLEFLGYRFTSFSQVFNFSITYGNGRLLGNISSVLLVTSRPLRTLVRALIMSLLTVLLPYAAGAKKKETYLLSCLLTVSLSSGVFAQVYAWCSGFHNYVPPVLATLIVYSAYRFCAEKKTGTPVYTALCVGVAVVSYSGQLFVEHSTCIAVLAAIILLAVSLKYGRKCLAMAVTSLTFSVLGAATMFLIPKFFAIPGNRSENARYWIFEYSGINKILNAFLTNVGKLTSYIATSLILVLALCLFVIFTVLRDRQTMPRIPGCIMLGVSFASIFFFTLNFFTNHVYALFGVRIDSILLTLLLLAFVCSLIMCSFMSLRTKITILVILILAAGALLPMAMVSPNGPRVVYHSYVFLSAAFLLAFDSAAAAGKTVTAKESKSTADSNKIRSGKGNKDRSKDKNDKTTQIVIPESFLKAVSALVLVAIMCFTLYIGSKFLRFGWLENVRTEHFDAETAAGATEIEYYSIRDNYLWVYESDNWPLGHCWYHEKCDDILFKRIDMDDWFEKYYDSDKK